MDHVPQIDEHGLRPPPAYELAREAVGATTQVVVCRGELDLASAGAVRRLLDEALAGGPALLVLDLEQVEFLDSTMLKELLRLRREVADAGARLVLAGLQEPLRRLLELTRTEALFVTAPSRADALADASGH